MTEHEITMDRTVATFSGWGYRRYRPWCACGWIGDRTKSMTAAQKQAEWHMGARLTVPWNQFG